MTTEIPSIYEIKPRQLREEIMQNVETFKPTNEMIDAARIARNANSIFENTQLIVRKYQQQIIDELQPVDAETGISITLPIDAYLMDRFSAVEYDAQCLIAAKEAGFDTVEGVCPLVRARKYAKQANEVLIDLMSHITGITLRMVKRDEARYSNAVYRVTKIMMPYID